MSKPLTGSIVAAGVQNAVVFNLDTPDTTAALNISGAYAGAQLVYEAFPVGVPYGGLASPLWFPLTGYQQDQAANVLASKAAPLVISPDGQTLEWKFDASLCQAIRVWALALGTGPVVVNWSSGSFYANPSAPGVGGVSLQQAILWQLMELTFWAAQGAGGTAQPNPVLPGGLPAAIWNRF